MAYIDLPTAGERTYCSTAQPIPFPQTLAPARFSALEWLVIAIARKDRLATLHRPGRIARAMGTLFGARQTLRLADERLEALRRVAVLGWHFGSAVPADELHSFTAAGFSIGQYELLLASIERA